MGIGRGSPLSEGDEGECSVQSADREMKERLLLPAVFDSLGKMSVRVSSQEVNFEWLLGLLIFWPNLYNFVFHIRSIQCRISSEVLVFTMVTYTELDLGIPPINYIHYYNCSLGTHA